MILTGKFMEADKINGNGDILPKKVVKKAVKKFKKRIEKYGCVYGELSHPEGMQTIPENVSHVIKDIYMKGNSVYGVVEVLDNEWGRTTKEIIKHSGRIGISARFLAKHKKKDGSIVKIRLETFDLVFYPAFRDAYVEMTKC